MRIGFAVGAKGSSAMFISRGLGGPKVHPNWSVPNGKPVNIPAPWVLCPTDDTSG